ncbi:hypothetical protein KZX45_09750 [Georgenia sp. EYE_87]|uniref:hypothetical protein n=1 Tax=Georgenia sp. EYE_87 TaxID=2853448 RepID=UPI00200381E3|nr:hypothetical protein [Georgenia sp. EYE_87]MCK6210824.1 hypothetical protein [Georgenia sp. EYE_87]
MYGAIWRLLPGPRWLKAIEALVLALAVVAVLFTWVFPWVAENFGMFETTVG